MPENFILDLSNCRYSIVSTSAKDLGIAIRPLSSRDACDETSIETKLRPSKRKRLVFWMDSGIVSNDVLMELRPGQIINHFPGMSQICHKCRLARLMCRLQKVFPGMFDFVPMTWCLPEERQSILKHVFHVNSKKKYKTKSVVIVKPAGGSRGRGIFLTSSPQFLLDYDSQNYTYNEPFVVQKYVKNPLLVNNRKFDIRIYVLVTSCYPQLRLFIHKQGLVRFCTEDYAQPSKDNYLQRFMHLTNSAINSRNVEYKLDSDGDDSGSASKWSLDQLFEVLEGERNVKREEIWDQICEIAKRTLLPIQTSLRHEYVAWFRKNRNESGFGCFEILGLDILLDENHKAWLLEVNCSPALTTGSELDTQVKGKLIRDTLSLVTVTEKFLKTPSTDENSDLPIVDIQKLRDSYEDSCLGDFEKLAYTEDENDEDQEESVYTENNISIISHMQFPKHQSRFDFYKELTKVEEHFFKKKRKSLYEEQLNEVSRLRLSLEAAKRGNRPPWNSSLTSHEYSEKIKILTEHTGCGESGTESGRTENFQGLKQSDGSSLGSTQKQRLPAKERKEVWARLLKHTKRPKQAKAMPPMRKETTRTSLQCNVTVIEGDRDFLEPKKPRYSGRQGSLKKQTPRGRKGIDISKIVPRSSKKEVTFNPDELQHAKKYIRDLRLRVMKQDRQARLNR